MTQSIREAAQALIDIVMQHCCGYTSGPGFEAAEKARALRAALSVPPPTADERVAELMRHVIRLKNMDRSDFAVEDLRACEQTVEQSARALLSAAQDDAEHAAMYRWLRDRGGRSWRIYPDGKPKQAIHATGEYYDDAVRAAMRDNP